MVEGNPKGLALRPVKKTILKKKPKTINVEKNYSEATQKRINGPISMCQGMGSFKPAGILTAALRAGWKQTCRKIAEKKVQDAEKANSRARREHVVGAAILPGESRAARTSRGGGFGPVPSAYLLFCTSSCPRWI